MALSDNLQYLRKKHKMTQEELAEGIGVTRQSVSKWETGEAYPDTDKLILLCEKFDISIDELVRGDVCERDSSLQGSAMCESEKSEYRCTTNKRRWLCVAINSAIELCALIAFLTFGFVWNLWYISWVAFVFSASLCSLVDGIINFLCADGDVFKKLLKAGGALSGFVMIMCAAVYLSIGMAIGMWHPTWVIFICGALICSAFEMVCKLGGDKKRS
jgi:transcriptional regulator with XRE-family HTH domain